MQKRSTRLLFIACVAAGALLAASHAGAKDAATEKQTAPIPCSDCHWDKTAKKQTAQVGCSNCHLDFIAGALPANGTAHPQHITTEKRQ
jgi:protein-arginine kinase activator protein McsA